MSLNNFRWAEKKNTFFPYNNYLGTQLSSWPEAQSGLGSRYGPVMMALAY